jgi:hypothetical protein
MKRAQIQLTFVFFILSLSAVWAQNPKDVVSEEINITKDREVEIQKANKIINKGQIIQNDKKDKKMTYTFFEKKPNAATESKFEPSVQNPADSKDKKNQDRESFNNYVKVGVGNFGRLYGEAYINSEQNKNFIYGISALHNSTKRGPIKDDFSAVSLNKLQLDGKYHLTNFEIKGDASYERRNYFFYGFDSLANSDYTKDDLRQKINLFGFNVAFENTNPKPRVDFAVKTGINFLDDNYNASELDWGSKFSSYFPIVDDKVVATLNAEAFITELTGNYDTSPTRKRNLYRVEPGFNFDFGKFSAKIGFKAVNEYDQILKINKTKGFPTALLSYRTPYLTYFFVGYDGDIIRNTLHSLFNENPFLVEQLNIQNTYKNSDFYIGARGELYSGLTFNTKISYGKYENLYFYTAKEISTDAPNMTRSVNTTKYELTYEDEGAKTDFINISSEFAWNSFDSWKSNLKLDYNYFETVRYNKAYHRPAFTARFGNVFTISDRLVSNLDIYYLTGIYARDIEVGEAIKLKDIVDLNADITYLFTKQFSTFVKLNNIVGKNYQRYYNYPQLGLNFVAGINFSF